ncbi:class I SAM-dependent methyltransferase [Haloterrigena sp. SYSU A558-1]|uniref:Class I SAM-dependent methyltransferase n=1 Tax=Haloterrigena gelatinilytica TaxID=2741724 RepID=A0ABX2L9U9_9EURY|nr:class I SAM-dependent methyltransferase [Haloterrigena gelatinilytica]NUC72170.1 class I SAM-dependent methyltransferase [Haloterrigena gelatinilytica]
MTTNESARHGHSHAIGDHDGIGNRSKSIPEIQDAVADHVDEMDGSSTVNRLLTARYRRRHFARAGGRVLDVACGTGTNVEYLPDDVAYVGVDICPEMLTRAADRFEYLTRGESLYEMDAQDLAFDDDSFDTVVSSMSTCMFPDPVAALEEMARVCTPDGRILLLEHGRSSVGPIARLQDWRAEPRYEKTGCRWNQEPLAIVSRSELTVEESNTGLLGMVTTITARPPERD